MDNIMLVLIEASAKPNVIAIRSKAGPLRLRPNLACKLVSGGARSSQPSCPCSSGRGTKAASPNLCNGVEARAGSGALPPWSGSKEALVAFLLISTVLGASFVIVGRSRPGGGLQRAASRAPMGTSPVSARRHSAITSLRISATIRTFFMRPLAPPRRALNHCASALSG